MGKSAALKRRTSHWCHKCRIPLKPLNKTTCRAGLETCRRFQTKSEQHVQHWISVIMLPYPNKYKLTSCQKVWLQENCGNYICAEDHAVRSENLQVIWMWHQTIQTHSSSWFWALLIFGSYSSVWPGIIPLTAITIELQLYDMQGFVRNQCIFSFLFKEGNTSVIPPTEMRTHKK